MKKILKNNLSNIIFLLPALCFLVFFVIYPIIKGISLSFTDWNGITSKYNFVGLKNYILMFSDYDVLPPIKNTLYYTLLTVFLENVIGLVLAYAISQQFKGANICKTIFFLPITISIILSSFIWSYIYLQVFPWLFGINGLLGDTSTVMIGIAIISLWRESGFAMVIYYAALMGVPEELRDASKIDGANAIQKLRYIDFPFLGPAFTINISMILGWSLKVFEQPLAATSGGPARASETFAMYVYKYTFNYNKVGYGQSIAVIMTIVIFIIIAGITAYLRKRELEL